MTDTVAKVIFSILTVFALYNIQLNSCECNKKEERILDLIQIIFIYIAFLKFINIVMVLKAIAIVLVSFFFVGIVRFIIEWKSKKNVQKTKKKCDCVK